MNARQQAEKVIDQLARKARPTLRVVRNKRRGAKSWMVICPRCVELGREKTEHLRQGASAIGCKEHSHMLAQRRYRKNHPERERIFKRRWEKRNPDRVKEKRKRQYKRHAKKRRESSLAYYYEHRDVILQKRKEAHSQNRDKKIAYLRSRRKSRSMVWRELVAIMPQIVPAEVF